MKLNKLTFTALAVVALVAQPFYAIAASQSASALTAVYSPVGINLADWAPDRATPTGGSSVVDFGGRTNVLAMSLDKDLANMSGSGFYQTEGLWRNVSGSTAIKADLYVDGDWLDNGKTVRAGIWGTAQNGATAVSAYPIVEFTTDGYTGWRSYNTINGVWNNSPVAYNVNAWNTLEVQLDATGSTFKYLVNGVQIGTAELNGSVSFKNVILNSKNYGPTAQSYTVRWSNFATGTHQATAVTNVNTGLKFDDLQSAVDAATAGDVLQLNEDLTLLSDVDITKSLVINGNGKTITANFIKSGNDNNSALSVLANDVTIKNVTLDGVAPVTNQLHGINAYQVTNLLVDGVTTKNFRTGILYNGSTGTIQNVHTINNAWHGINIDKAGSNVNVLGTNTHTEPFNIYVDNDTVGVTVNAPAYEWSRSGLEGRDNDRVYRKKVVVTPVTPVTPTNPTTPQDGGDNGEVPVSGGSGSASSSSDTDVAVAESTTTTNESNDAEVLGTDESDVDTSSAQDTKEEKHWSLVNVLLAGVAVVMSIITLAGIRGSEGRAKWLRILTIIPAVGAIIAVLTVEDFTATLGWVNGWTLLFVAIAIAQTILMTSVKPADN